MRRNRMSRKPWDSVADRSTAWLGPSLHVKGDLTGTEDLLIDGAIEGMLQLNEHKLTVGMAAKLKADINAREVVVYGCVQGNSATEETDKNTLSRKASAGAVS